MKCPIWPIDGSLTGTTNPSQSGSESIGNEGLLHIPQTFRTGTSPSDTVKCQDTQSYFSQLIWPPATTFEHLHEKFKEYVWNNHIGAKAWHDQPTDLIGPLRLFVQPSKGHRRVLQVTWPLQLPGQWLLSHNYPVLKHYRSVGLLIICLHTIKWFQVLLCHTNNSIEHQLFVCTQLNCQTVYWTHWWKLIS